MSNIQIRIAEKEKRAAQRVFDDIGLDMSTAVRLFFKQATLRKGIPFLVTTENGLTLEEENAIIEASSEARVGKNISRAMSGQKAIARLKSL